MRAVAWFRALRNAGRGTAHRSAGGRNRMKTATDRFRGARFESVENRQLRLEPLESRWLLSATLPAVPSANFIPNYVASLSSTGASGYSPTQIRAAYGFNSVPLDGAGTTIAIVDAYDNPNIAGDLRQFDAQFGLPNPLLIKENQNGGTNGMPAANPIWAGEIALDVEWAHAIAPGASILLVEANSAAASDLMAAVNTARNALGVAVVSMSWGASEFIGESSLDSYFTTPAGHNGVTFVAASGDSGAGVSYPAASPNVVSVGGTSLSLSGGSYTSESAWSGSGGGVSSQEAEPAYQKGVVSPSNADSATTGRATPDVAFDADPNTGVPVYDSYDVAVGGGSGWQRYGGSSAAAPQWAALVALADQGRAQDGLESLDGPSQTLPLLYSMPASDFHDITTGSNSGSPQFYAGPGYDLVTGRGTPLASLVIPSLVGGTVAPAAMSFGVDKPVQSKSGASLAVNPVSIVFKPLPVTLPPKDLTYSTNPAVYDEGFQITPDTPSNTGGRVASYSVSPALPGGLGFNTSNGFIEGAPTVVAAQANYTVTAFNSAGSTTASLNITVLNPVPIFANLPDQIWLVGSAITPIVFTNMGGAPTYVSDSPHLPAGLSIALYNATGEIAGIPTVSSSALYTVTANNSTGSCTATVIITTSTNISLPTTLSSGVNEVLTAGEVYPIDTALQFSGGSLDLGGTTQTVASVGLAGGSLTDGNLAVGSVTATAGAIGANLSGPATLTVGPSAGSVTLSGNDSYSGGTVVNGGTLLDDTTGAGMGTGPVAVDSGGTLSGDGIISAATTVNSGGSLAPGNGGIDTLTVDNSLLLAGGAAAAMDINAATGGNDLVQGLTTVTYGGTLTVTNLAGTLAFGDNYTLFSAGGYTGGFSAFNLPTLPAGLSWDTSQLTVNGSIRVVHSTAIPTAAAAGAYGGTATATVTLTSSGAPLANEPISFSLNGAGVGTVTTNASGVATLTGISLAGYNAGTYTSYLVASFAGDANYFNSTTDANLVVNPATLTVTTDLQTKVYGTPNPTLTGAVSGLENGDLITASYSTAASQFSDVAAGGYLITAALSDPGNRLSNYTLVNAGNTLAITPANQAITWATPAAITYGTALGGTQLDAAAAGLSGGAAAGSLSYSPPEGAVLSAGSQTLSVAVAATTDYSAATATVTLPVNPATLTVTTDPQTKVYGTPDPTLTGSVSGLENGDLITASYSTTASQFSDVAAGGYPITAALSDPDDRLSNYMVVNAGNTLTITPATQAITWGTLAAITYGTALGGTQLDAAAAGVSGGAAAGSLTYGPPAGAVLSAGSQTLSVTAAATQDYSPATATVTLLVNPAALTITASPQDKTYGVALNLGTTAFSTLGLVTGDVVTGVTLASPGAAATAAVAGSPYTITASGATGTGLGNYTISYDPGSLTVNPAALTITASPQSKTYGTALNLGTTAFTTAGLVNGDKVTGATLASSGAPATAAVAGSPYPITASAATGTGLGNYTISYDAGLLTVSPAAVLLTLQSDVDWLLAGQDLSVDAIASSNATSNGLPLPPDGTVTFYDNGATLAMQPLALVDGQDEAILNTSALAAGRQLITVGYTSGSGNFAMTAASPVVTELVFPANANVLTVLNTSSDPSVTGSLPWAVAQADASDAAAVITFASGSGQVFATPQTISLEAPLDVSDTNPVGIEGPSWGVTLVGDYSQSRFPLLSVEQDANILVQGVSDGTQSPGADGDLQVAGVLDVIGSVGNLGSAVNATGGGTIDLGGQTATADTLTVTDGSVLDGTLSSGTRTVSNGTISANLTGTGGLVKTGSGNVVLSGTNTFSGGVQVQGGTLALASAGALPMGSGLWIGAAAASLFSTAQSPVAAMGGSQSSEVGDPAVPASAAVVASPGSSGAVAQIAKGPEIRQIGNLPYVSRKVEYLPSSRQVGNLSTRAHDAVMQSLNTSSSLDDDMAAAFWDADRSWSDGQPGSKHHSIESAVDTVMRRSGFPV